MQIGDTWIEPETGTMYRVIAVEIIDTGDGGAPVVVSRGEPVEEPPEPEE